jgi:hypothetical protein
MFGGRLAKRRARADEHHHGAIEPTFNRNQFAAKQLAECYEIDQSIFTSSIIWS